MSGMEIAGLVLGGLPVLSEALSSYNKGMRSIKSALHRRKTVEELARAIQMQMVILDLLIKNIMLQSGCILPSDDVELHLLLQNASTRDRVERSMGATNFRTFTEALDECLRSVQAAIVMIAGFVPAVKDNAKIKEILDANRTVKQSKVNFAASISIMWSINDLKSHIVSLDRSSSTLERFTTLVLMNARTIPSTSLLKNVKLAAWLRSLCRSADSLYDVLAKCWSETCHIQHEVRLFLNDETARMSQADSSEPPARIEDPFVTILCGYSKSRCFWRFGTMFYVANDGAALDSTHNDGIRNPPRDLQQTTCPTPSMVGTDLCSVVVNAANDRSEAVFHLSANQELAVTLVPKKVDMSDSKTNLVTLRSILTTADSQKQLLPWKDRMLLASKITSNFLQFFRTSWVQSSWSAGMIFFGLSDRNVSKIDLSHPCIVHKFTENTSAQKQKHSLIREDLVELGILLLEIWHGSTLEKIYPSTLSQNQVKDRSPDVPAGLKSGLPPGIEVFSVRHAYAWMWFTEVEVYLPNLYSEAIRHCIDDVPFRLQYFLYDFDETPFWRETCEKLVQPLFRLSQI